MLVEHSFVTTLDEAEALSAARTLLVGFGFVESLPTPSGLEARRGLSNAARAKSVAELPQRLQLHYDRGRITVAALIEPRGKPKELHEALLMTLAQALESYLVRGGVLDDIAVPWRTLHLRIAEAASRARRARAIAVVVLLLIIFLPLGILLFSLAR